MEAVMESAQAAFTYSFNQTQNYLSVLDDVTKYQITLSWGERLWAAWYQYMGNDVLATGLMSFIMHEVVYFGRSVPFILCDFIPQFRKYKLQNQKMPSMKEQLQCAGAVLLSHVTVELPQIWFFHPLATACGLSYSVPFPPWWKMAFQISVFFVMEDTWHYWFHRALHYGPLYKNIHKMHHLYSTPFGMAAEYASPIEVMLLGTGIVGSPILWVLATGDLHLLTMYVWIILRLFQAIDAHSGYDFPWSLRRFLPFWAGAHHHDLHHEKFIGNYASSFRWWDYMLDTEAGTDAQKRRREKKLESIKAQKSQ